MEECKHCNSADKSNMVCGLSIPNWLLVEWHGAESYVQELNNHVVRHALQIKSTSQRVEGRLRCQSGSVFNSMLSKSRRKKENFLEKSYLLQVYYTCIASMYNCTRRLLSAMNIIKYPALSDCLFALSANKPGHHTYMYIEATIKTSKELLMNLIIVVGFISDPFDCCF